MGDHRECGLVERTIQTIKRRLGVMLLDENVQPAILRLSTIIRDLRWNKQKTIVKLSPFEAHFGRLPKTEFKILRDKFINESGRLDKEHLERSAITASQLKRRIDQSMDNVKIIRKGQNSRDVSPLFLRSTAAGKGRAIAKELKQLLEANARWNATRRDTSANELRRIVDETSTINRELRKELLYSWERGFIEDKQSAETDNWSGNFLRKHEQRKSGKALAIPLKGKIVAETPSTVKTAASAVYRKSDIANYKVSVQSTVSGSEKKRNPTGDEPRSKQQKTVREYEEADSESAEENDMDDQWRCNKVPIEDSRATTNKFQNSPTIVTSKDTETGDGLNLGGKRNKPNRAGPSVQNQKSSMSKPTAQEARRLKAVKIAAKDPKDRDTVDHDFPASSTPKKVSESQRIIRQTKEKEILDTIQNKDMTPEEWDKLAEQVLTRGGGSKRS